MRPGAAVSSVSVSPAPRFCRFPSPSGKDELLPASRKDAGANWTRPAGTTGIPASCTRAQRFGSSPVYPVPRKQDSSAEYRGLPYRTARQRGPPRKIAAPGIQADDDRLPFRRLSQRVDNMVNDAVIAVVRRRRAGNRVRAAQEKRVVGHAHGQGVSLARLQADGLFTKYVRSLWS